MPTSQFSAAGLYEFWSLGDVNLDGKIDDKDLDLITDFIGSFWPGADLDEDGQITAADYQIAVANYGKDIYTYFNVWNEDIINWCLIGGGILAAGFILAAIYYKKF